jgi:glycosyltransferase involved in cell wall biosynthesis/uncharacterized MnhB-related membrane protein
MSLTSRTKIVTSGKFFASDQKKFFFKAVRLEGSFAALAFTDKVDLQQRFNQLSRSHTTGLVLSADQVLTNDRDNGILGLAASAGLYALVEFSLNIEDLQTRSRTRTLAAQLTHKVSLIHHNAGLIGYLLDLQVDPVTLRHRGLAHLRKQLIGVIRAVRRADNDRMVGLTHRPCTVGLASLDEDFIYAQMPALEPSNLGAYAHHLHNLAESRPVVFEFGAGLPGQDELVACAFGHGAAGVVAPVMLPVASSGWLELRTLSVGELLPFVTLNGSCPPQPAEPPLISVVICAYNAERTMHSCLESLRKLDYPNFEVVIVDDGSRDATAEIAMDFPEFRLIRQPNKGLSVARNVGMRAARGELIAYTDSDCVVDPHWLTLMVRAMHEHDFDGCGGPNYAPHEEGWIEACCAASPGAPCHVLTGDNRAEHLAGCNMIYRKSALAAIGGFDSQFTAAGDDVDICWRMIDAGFTLGFCPSAFVWHFRRNTIKAYYGQQRGYGKAEAMLFLKYPDRFNALGQIGWRGTIPGLARTVPGGNGNRIGWVRDASALQKVAEPPLSILKVLPLTAEWNAAAVAVMALCWMIGITLLPAATILALGPVWSFYYAANAPLEKCHRGFIPRMLIAYLAFTGPIVRTIARYRYRKDAGQMNVIDTPPRQRPAVSLIRRCVRLAYWNENSTTRDQLLERAAHLLARSGRPAAPEPGWNDADLVLEPGALTRIEVKTADEEHGGSRIKTHVEVRGRLHWTTRAGIASALLITVVLAALGNADLAIASGIVATALTVCAFTEAVGSMRRTYHVLEHAAEELGLLPLGRATAAARRAAPALNRQEVKVHQPSVN